MLKKYLNINHLGLNVSFRSIGLQGPIHATKRKHATIGILFVDFEFVRQWGPETIRLPAELERKYTSLFQYVKGYFFH